LCIERPDIKEKLFRSYVDEHHEEYNEDDEIDIAWIPYKPVLYGKPAPNYSNAFRTW